MREKEKSEIMLRRERETEKNRDVKRKVSMIKREAKIYVKYNV